MVTKKRCLLNKSFYSSDAQAVKVVNTSAQTEHDFEHFSPEMDRPTYLSLNHYSTIFLMSATSLRECCVLVLSTSAASTMNE